MITSVSLRSRRIALFAALACAAVPLVASAVHSDPTASISGNPQPPVQVAVGTAYNITVSGVPDAGYSICEVDASSSSGGPDRPSGSWQEHGYYSTFSNTPDVPKQHTFNMVNQTSGFYYWQPDTIEVQPGSSNRLFSEIDPNNYIGYYYSPYGNGYGGGN